MKKVSKILLVIAMILNFIIIPQISFAKSTTKNPPGKLQRPGTVSTDTSDNNLDDISQWDFSMDQEVPTKVTDKVGKVIRFLRNFSIILTVLVITILGIKYMIGSVEQKADYKKAYVNIIMGVVLITMITSIVDMIFSAAQN